MAQQLGSFEKVLRVGEGRRLKRLAQQAAYIGTLEPDFEQLSDEELAARFLAAADRPAVAEAHIDVRATRLIGAIRARASA